MQTAQISSRKLLADGAGHTFSVDTTGAFRMSACIGLVSAAIPYQIYTCIAHRF